MSDINKTYFQSKKFPGYQHLVRDLSPVDPPPLGFSGLPLRNPYHKSLPEKCHHKSSEAWKGSHAVSNVEKRVISALLFVDEFQKQIQFLPVLKDLSGSKLHGLQMGISGLRYFLLEIEESYGRMSRRKQKGLDVLQNKQVLATWEVKTNRGKKDPKNQYASWVHCDDW